MLSQFSTDRMFWQLPLATAAVIENLGEANQVARNMIRAG